MSVRKLPSNRMLQLLERLQAIPCFPAADVASNLDFLHTTAARADGPLRSTYDSAHEVNRPRPARRPRQGQGRALRQRGRVLAARRPRRPRAPRLAKTLVRPKEVFDAKIAACREALDGSPRAAIERALSRPHDYLACECCDQVEGQLASSQPRRRWCISYIWIAAR